MQHRPASSSRSALTQSASFGFTALWASRASTLGMCSRSSSTGDITSYRMSCHRRLPLYHTMSLIMQVSLAGLPADLEAGLPGGRNLRCLLLLAVRPEGAPRLQACVSLHHKGSRTLLVWLQEDLSCAKCRRLECQPAPSQDLQLEQPSLALRLQCQPAPSKSSRREQPSLMLAGPEISSALCLAQHA